MYAQVLEVVDVQKHCDAIMAHPRLPPENILVALNYANTRQL